MRRIIECTLAIVLLAGCTNGPTSYSKPIQRYVTIDNAYTRSILQGIQDRSFRSFSGFKSLQQLAQEADSGDGNYGGDGNCTSIEASRLQRKYQRNYFQ